MHPRSLFDTCWSVSYLQVVVVSAMCYGKFLKTKAPVSRSFYNLLGKIKHLNKDAGVI